jgi:hypothetical protein
MLTSSKAFLVFVALEPLYWARDIGSYFEGLKAGRILPETSHAWDVRNLFAAHDFSSRREIAALLVAIADSVLCWLVNCFVVPINSASSIFQEDGGAVVVYPYSSSSTTSSRLHAPVNEKMTRGIDLMHFLFVFQLQILAAYSADQYVPI